MDLDLKLLWRIFLPALLLSMSCNSNPIDCTITHFGGPAGPGKKCQFPFTLNGQTYERCTDAFESDQRPWCPTELNPDGTYSFSSFDWSYCHSKCPYLTINGVLMNADFINRSTSATDTTTMTTLSSSTTTIPSTTSYSSTEFNSTSQTDDPSSVGTWLPNATNLECGFSLDFGYIIGGSDAKLGEFPFIALLGYFTDQGDVEYTCGGTLINRWYVITSAHCQQAGVREIGVVLLGEFNLKTNPDCDGCRGVDVYYPARVIAHETWTFARSGSGGGGTSQDDIALIRLDRPVTTVFQDESSLVLPVCLDPRSSSFTGDYWIAGWGEVTNNAFVNANQLKMLKVGATTLQKLKVPLVDQNQCKVIFNDIKDKQICAGGEEGQDSCHGDSGGPLVIKTSPDDVMYLRGIVSSGTLECGIGQPGIYTNVNEHLTWIIEHLEP